MEFWFSEMHTPHVKYSVRVDRQVYSGKSEFQRIDVFDSPEFGRFLTLDGYMMLTEKDEFIYHEMITHVPMAVHPNVKRVLVIGRSFPGQRIMSGCILFPLRGWMRRWRNWEIYRYILLWIWMFWIQVYFRERGRRNRAAYLSRNCVGQ